MKKTIYMLARSHMDPVWRRCCGQDFRYEGQIVRPYAQIEEAQLRRWLDIIEQTPAKYAVEQVLTLRLFLERNPDQRERMRRLVATGKLEVLGGGETARGIEVQSCNGQPLRVLSVETLPQRNGVALRVRFTGLEVPSLGYATVYYRLAASAPASPVAITADHIENEFYRIEFDGMRITRVLDRQLAVVIGTEKFGALEIEQDIGSPWETLATPYFNRCLHDEEDTSVTVQQITGGQRLIFAGQYRNMRSGHVRRLAWRQEVTLVQGVRTIFFKTTSDWDARNARLKVLFPAGFTTPENAADYEIPYHFRAYGNRKGVFTRDRQPKLLAHDLRDVWADKCDEMRHGD